MFMDVDRLPVMQEMVVAATLEDRLVHLKKLGGDARGRSPGIFKAMDGLPVTVKAAGPASS